MVKTVILFFVISFGLASDQGFEWVSFEMKQRTNQNGVTSETRSLVYFDRQSDMNIRQLYPMDLFVRNNRDGELTIYNPKTNEVFQTMNFMMGSQQNHFFYFLMNKTDDMGLSDLGFTLSGSRLEDQLLISTYKSPVEARKYFEEIELVHKGKQPIFLGYIDKKGKFLKKVFYYDYFEKAGVVFPASITEISYIDKKDSIISKTSFDDFRINDQEHKSLAEFEIPDNATLISQ